MPENVACTALVKEVLHWDDAYRKELAVRKYLQEYRMLPTDEPVKAFRKEYHLPVAGVDLGLAIRNLSKNVSVWKKRIGDSRYPEAEQKHAMYVAHYMEARKAAAEERTRMQKIANDHADNEH